MGYSALLTVCSAESSAMPIIDIDTYGSSKTGSQVCPRCGDFIFLVPRTRCDRWINGITLGLKRRFRYKCKNCQKEFIINSAKLPDK